MDVIAEQQQENDAKRRTIQEREAMITVEDMAREAAQHGRLRLVEFYRGRSRDEQQRILAIKSELEQLYPGAASLPVITRATSSDPAFELPGGGN